MQKEPVQYDGLCIDSLLDLCGCTEEVSPNAVSLDDAGLVNLGLARFRFEVPFGSKQ